MGPVCLITGRPDDRRAVTRLIWAMWGMPIIEVPTVGPAPGAASWLQRLASPPAGMPFGRRRRSQARGAERETG
jgi:hypothetical protein